MHITVILVCKRGSPVLGRARVQPVAVSALPRMEDFIPVSASVFVDVACMGQLPCCNMRLKSLPVCLEQGQRCVPERGACGSAAGAGTV